MPLVRYEIRNEYNLANPELYRSANNDDSQALLEAVSIGGVVGIVRQLGNLAEFAAEVFHDLHEELMTTAARGHRIMIRVQQLEADLPLVEKTLITKTNQLCYAYAPGAEWHASIRNNQNHLTQGVLPRFILNSYEECRGPPRLFLLDKFDVAGAGACLKRYTDPSFFKMEWASSELMKAEKLQRDKRARKKKGQRRRNGEMPKVASATSRVRYSSLDLDQPGYNPRMLLNSHHQNLEFRQSHDSSYQNEGYDNISFQISLDTFGSPQKNDHIDDYAQSTMEKKSSTKASNPSLREGQVCMGHPFKFSYNSPAHKDNINALFNYTLPEKAADIHPDKIYEEQAGPQINGEKQLEIDASKDGNDDVLSEVDNYMDALATMDSEIETDSDERIKHGADSDLHSDDKVTSKVSNGESKKRENVNLESNVNSFILHSCDSLVEASKVETSSQPLSQKVLGAASTIGYETVPQCYPHDITHERSVSSVHFVFESVSDKSTDTVDDGFSSLTLLRSSSEQQNGAYVLSNDKTQSETSMSSIKNNTRIVNDSINSKKSEHHCMPTEKEIPIEAELPNVTEMIDNIDLISSATQNNSGKSVIEKKDYLDSGNDGNARPSSSFVMENEASNIGQSMASPYFKGDRTPYEEPVMSQLLGFDVLTVQTEANKLDEGMTSTVMQDERHHIRLETDTTGTTTHNSVNILTSVSDCVETLVNTSCNTTEQISVNSGTKSGYASQTDKVVEFCIDAVNENSTGLETTQTCEDVVTNLSSIRDVHTSNEDVESNITHMDNVEDLHKDATRIPISECLMDGLLDTTSSEIHGNYQTKKVLEAPATGSTSMIPISDCYSDNSLDSGLQGSRISVTETGEDVHIKEVDIHSEHLQSLPGLANAEADMTVKEGTLDREVPDTTETTHPQRACLSAGSFKNIFDGKPDTENFGSSSEVCCALQNFIRPVKPAGVDPLEEADVELPPTEDTADEPHSPPLEHIRIDFQSGLDSPLSLSPASSGHMLGPTVDAHHSQHDNQMGDLPNSLHSLPNIKECVNISFSQEFYNQSSDSSGEFAVYSGRTVIDDVEEDISSDESSSTSSLSCFSTQRTKDNSSPHPKFSSALDGGSSQLDLHNTPPGSSPRSFASSEPHSQVSLENAYQRQTKSSYQLHVIESDTKFPMAPAEQAQGSSQSLSPPSPPVPPAEWDVSKKNEEKISSQQIHPPTPPPLPLLLEAENGRLKPEISSSACKMGVTGRNNSLIEAIASHDKSTLKKVPKQVVNKSKISDDREVLLEQIRNQSFNLRRTPEVKHNITRPVTNINVAAILEKANAIRQAYEGSDEEEEEDDDDWN